MLEYIELFICKNTKFNFDELSK